MMFRQNCTCLNVCNLIVLSLLKYHMFLNRDRDNTDHIRDSIV